MIRGLSITADGTARVVDFEPLAPVVQALIGGGWLEAHGSPTWTAYCEDGGPKRLPVNEPATTLARTLGWRRGARLLGTVLFVGGPDDDGDDTPVSEHVLATARMIPGLDWMTAEQRSDLLDTTVMEAQEKHRGALDRIATDLERHD